jgi:hypothetical protein
VDAVAFDLESWGLLLFLCGSVSAFHIFIVAFTHHFVHNHVF